MKIATAARMVSRYEHLLGPVAAGLLGAASAFFCFAMPAAIVAGLVAALGLPPALSESRLVLALGIGVAVAVATWFVFAWLDRAARPRHVGALEGEADVAPVLRRADVHPDAPPRRPIFAGSDLGTPLDLVDPLPADWQAPDTTLVVSYPAVDYAEFETIEAPAPVAVRPDPALPPAAPSPPPRAEASVPQASLAVMMTRLEAGLARKALVLAGAEPNVTPMKREIRPISGPLREVVEELRQRTAARG